MYLPADSPKENEGDWALQVFNVPSAPPPLGVLLQNLISSQQEVLLGCICWVMDDGCEHFTANTWLSWGLGLGQEGLWVGHQHLPQLPSIHYGLI